MKSQNGNILFLILIAVALFAALSYAVTKSTSGGGNASKERAALIASEITQYATSLKVAVLRMSINGVSDEDFCFDTPVIVEPKAYDNASGCSNDANKLFHSSGGGASYQPVNPSALNSANSAHSQYGLGIISGRSPVINVGDNTEADIVYLAHFLTKEICDELNKNLGLPAAISSDYLCCGTDIAKHFQGFFGGQNPIGSNNNDVSVTAAYLPHAGMSAGCIDEDGTGRYYYYHVLLER